jgi:hypothetical protein
VKWFLIDRIFPLSKPFTEQEARREQEFAENEQKESDVRVAALPDDAALVSAYLAQCTALLDEEDDRRRGVEGRLTSILGLSSIAGTIVFGGILAQASGTVGSQTITFRVVMALGALYLALQICSAIFAAIRGLERRGYQTATISGIVLLPAVAHLYHLRGQITDCANRLADHRAQNNRKVDEMANAHCAMKNFVGGLILLALFGTYYAIRAKPTNNVIQTLKTNHELNELLRGPQGPKGDRGPAGPAAMPAIKPPSSQPHQ